MKKATHEQQAILDCNENIVVIATPGSGKTYVLSTKIKQNLKSLLSHQGIIAISYTNKASQELKDRSLSNGENPKRSFFGTIDKFYISEIIIPFGKHVFGLNENSIEVKNMSKQDGGKFDRFNNQLSLDLIPSNYILFLKSNFLKGIIYIETLGLLSNYIFSKSKSCREYIKSRYKSIYIDEYQDSGYHQHQIFLKITSLGIISTGVGDLNQSIFEYAGKHSDYLEELKSNLKFKSFLLTKNHRCHPSIINYSNCLLNSQSRQLSTNEKRVVYCNINGNEVNICNYIDMHIIKNISNVNLNKIAILTRTSATAKIVDQNLKTSHRLIIANKLDNHISIWASIFSKLLNYIHKERESFIDIIELYLPYSALSKKKRKKLFLIREEIKKEKYSCPDTVHIKEHFITIAETIAPHERNEESVTLLEYILKDENRLKSYKPIEKGEVPIMTLHKSKGLEFDFVIHLDLYDWVFPSKYPGPNKDFNNCVYPSRKQDKNLHYVGITRAKEWCFLISSTQRTKNGISKKGVPSEFIQIPELKVLRHNV